MVRLSKRTIALVSAGALSVGGATIGWAATSGSDKSPAAALADALNKNEGTHLTEADVRQAMQDVFKARLDAAVKAGTLTQAQADEMLQRAKSGPRPPAGPAAHRSERIGPVAKALGMSAEEVFSALGSGKTLAKLAQEKGVPRAKLLAAIKEGIQAEAKEHGRTLSAAQLDAAAARMADAPVPVSGAATAVAATAGSAPVSAPEASAPVGCPRSGPRGPESGRVTHRSSRCVTPPVWPARV